MMDNYPMFFRVFTSGDDGYMPVEVWKQGAATEDFERDFRSASIMAAPIVICKARKNWPNYPVVSGRDYQDILVELLSEKFGWVEMCPAVQKDLGDSDTCNSDWRDTPDIPEEAWDTILEHNKKVMEDE